MEEGIRGCWLKITITTLLSFSLFDSLQLMERNCLFSEREKFVYNQKVSWENFEEIALDFDDVRKKKKSKLRSGVV